MDKVPNEVLSKIFWHVSNDDKNNKIGVQAIHNLRLVSHRIKLIATAYLIQDASVCLSTVSFAEFEKLCSHPDYRRSIRTVKISASYYDGELAADRLYFCQRASTQMYQRAETMERSFRFDTQFNKDAMVKRMFDLSHYLSRIERNGFTDPPATTTERNLTDYHVEYQKRTADQEELRRDNNHLQRLCQAIRNLSALEEIILSDGPVRFPRTVAPFLRSDGTPDDLRILSTVLDRMRWKGCFDTAYRTNQPLEMVGELLAQLGRTGIRPRSIRIDLSVPADLTRLRVDADQSRDIQHLVSQVTGARLVFSSWDRKGSLAENNDRSTEEMCALGSLSRALTGASTLQSLELSLYEYPVFYQVPTASMAQLLPIDTAKWTKLHTVQLRHVPFNMSELELFSRAHRHSITSLFIQSPSLLTGDWDRAIDVLRELDRLEEAHLKYPNGGRYGYRSGWLKDFPEDEVRQYLLRQSSENPLEPVAELPAT